MKREHNIIDNIHHVEYLTVDGTKFVRTGVFLGQGVNDVRMEFGVNMTTTTDMIANAYDVNLTTDKNPIQIYALRNVSYLFNHAAYKASSPNTYYDITTRTTASTRYITFNGQTASSSAVPVPLTSNVEIYLLNSAAARGTTTGLSGKVYYWKIYVNDVLVRDYTMATDGVDEYFYDSCGSISQSTGTSYYLVEQY